MKNLSLLTFFLLSTFCSYGQIVVDPGSIHVVAEGENVELKPKVHNTSDEEVSLYWMFEPAEDFPIEWSVVICDVELCYPPGTEKSSLTNPNIIPANSSVEFKFSISCNQKAGNSYGILTLFDDVNCENVVGVSSVPTSTKDVLDESVIVYPNPTSQYLAIQNDENVSQIELRSITGNLLMNVHHSQGRYYDLSEYHSGLYFLRMLDAAGLETKTVRIVKK